MTEIKEKSNILGWLFTLAWVPLVSLGYLAGNDAYKSHQQSILLADETTVLSVLTEYTAEPIEAGKVTAVSGMESEEVIATMSRLIVKGLVDVTAENTYRLTTDRIQQNTMEIRENMLLLQADVRDLESARNKLLEEQVSLRKESNLLATQLVNYQESTNALLKANNRAVEKSLTAFELDSKYKLALTAILDGLAPKPTAEDVAILNEMDQVGVQPDDILKMYSIIAKYYPADFPAPSEDPFGRIDTPEMKLYGMVLAQPPQHASSVGAGY